MDPKNSSEHYSRKKQLDWHDYTKLDRQSYQAGFLYKTAPDTRTLFIQTLSLLSGQVPLVKNEIIRDTHE